MDERRKAIDVIRAMKSKSGQFDLLLTMLKVDREFQPGPNTEYAARIAAFFSWVDAEEERLQQVIHELKELDEWKDSEPGQGDGVFMMPEGTARFFGRDEQLEELDRYFASGDSRRKAAVYGMGGVGKTQFAVRYARTRREKYRHAFFIGADSRLVLDNHFADIARRLNLPVSKRQDATPEEILRAVHFWMETHGDWLAIFDNADDLTIVRDYLPPNGAGHLILTTRESAPDEIAHPVSLDVFTEDEATQFLLKKTEKSDEAAARALAREMDGLPLALDQAVAYIREMKSSLAEYLKLYQAEGRELRKRRGTYVVGHESVATTFGLAFQQIEGASPATADILRVCAFCNPDEIPEELFLDSGDALGETITVVNGSVSTWLKALYPATRFSLLVRDPENRMLALHQVIQDVIKDEMTEGEQRQWAERFIVGLNGVFPEVKFENWSSCGRLISQAFAAFRAVEHFSMETETSARLLHYASFFDDHARYAEAELLYKRALGIRERVLGGEHPDTALLLNDLALIYYYQGWYVEAEPLYKRALGIRERALGMEHPDMAESLNNLALLYDSQGRYGEAELLYERALGIWERALGAEHPSTALSLNNLAVFYREQGRNAEAGPLYERALGIWERALGVEHPLTATSLNNLAEFYELQGQYADAELLYERALGIWERALGTKHPSTALSLNNLGLLYTSQGRYAEAKPLLERALTIFQKALGDEHPNTKTVAENLETLRRKMSGEESGL
jgi:tetratricopeptide (TPR) repeat protein